MKLLKVTFRPVNTAFISLKIEGMSLAVAKLGFKIGAALCYMHKNTKYKNYKKTVQFLPMEANPAERIIHLGQN